MNRIFTLLLLLLPTVGFFFQTGIHSMHDPHLFRQYEFSRECMANWSFPCRWTPDSGLGYGEPLFNFYGQLPYWLGHIFFSFGLSIIGSLKAVFIFSLAASALAMFALASAIYGKNAGLVAAIFYTYAPYRAVDVWVRGNVSEALAFVFLPLLLLFSKTKKWLWFALILAALISTHNLSVLMFTPFLLVWLVLHIKSVRQAANVVWATLLSLLLSAFYWLPVAFESHLVTLPTITEGYFNFQLHFATLNQLFISRFWGYGASLWGPQDDLSFSVGHLHWLVALITLFFLPRMSKQNKLRATCYVLFALAAIFMTHGKSLFIWKLFPPLAFIQFPWRFLEIATVFTSLLAGFAASHFASRKVTTLLLVTGLLVTGKFFVTNDWRAQTDSQFFSGANWTNQKSTSLKDYWPSQASSFPTQVAPTDVEFATGLGSTITSSKLGPTANYTINVTSPQALVVFPIVDFPTWELRTKDYRLKTHPYGPLALVSVNLPRGVHQVQLQLLDTPIRTTGNIISLISLIGLIGHICYAYTRPTIHP